MPQDRRTARRFIGRAAMAVFVLAAVVVQTASAGNFHFNSIGFSLGSLTLHGDLAGLGNASADVTLIGYGTVTAMCENNGGKQAPGRNPVTVEVQQTVHVTTDQNGKTHVEVSAPDPTAAGFEPSATPKQAGCPNGKWSVVDIMDGSTNWTAAEVIVKDGAGIVQLDLFFTCTTTFDGGLATGLVCNPA